jgi:mRNA-degrading endonuclease RelE of RelBE toxin-antitoxin system
MVDTIRKTLKRLPAKQRTQLLEALRLIRTDDLTGLDVKKLQGRNDVYRVRKGVFRVIFRKIPNVENTIIAIERRSDTTYNEF